jgi:hypothetical protein
MKSFDYLKRTLLMALTGMGIMLTIASAQTGKDQSVVITDTKAVYSIPEVYELMHIAIALTDTSIVTNHVKMHANNVNTNTAYYQLIIDRFGAYRDHDLVKKLNKSFAKSAMNYVYQLQNAYNAAFDHDQIIKEKKMPTERLLWIGLNSVSKEDIAQFGSAIGFRAFYQNQLPFYIGLLQHVLQLLNIPQIQRWLEDRFSTRYDQYQIVLSPLAGGFHFTQRFTMNHQKTNVIWISAPYRYDTSVYSAQQIAALYTSVAFTEIDHNYVNPVSDQYKAALNTVMGGVHRSKWIDERGDASMYGNGYAIFNEYMTHAVYMLYVKDHFDAKAYALALKSKTNSMVNARKYRQFKQFYDMLLGLYENRTNGQTIEDLYPAVIEWCRGQVGEL